MIVLKRKNVNHIKLFARWIRKKEKITFYLTFDKAVNMSHRCVRNLQIEIITL